MRNNTVLELSTRQSLKAESIDASSIFFVQTAYRVELILPCAVGRSTFILFIIFALFSLTTGTPVDLTEIKLNSREFCNRNESFLVDYLEEEYRIVPNKDKSFAISTQECRLLFQSKRQGGRLCFSQEGAYAKIGHGARLNVYTGRNTRDSLLQVTPGRPSTKHRERCSQYRYMLVRWHGYKRLGADPLKITGDFKVVDIRSENRRAYLDEEFCGSGYILDHSMVEVVNRLGYNVPVHNVNTFCIVMLFQESSDVPRRICAVYFPSKDLDCENDASSDWELIVFETSENFKNKEYIFNMTCSDPRLKTTVSFCTPKAAKNISVVMNRSSEFRSDSTREPPFLFRLQVSDWDRTEAELETVARKKLEEKLEKIPDESQGKYPGQNTTQGTPAPLETNTIPTEKPNYETPKKKRESPDSNSVCFPVLVFVIMVAVFLLGLVILFVARKRKGSSYEEAW